MDAVGRDRTPHERVMAEKAKPLPMEFGELVQWRTRPVGSGALGKLDSVWEHGVFLEVNGKTVEIAIGARSRIFKARTDRRRSTDDRWKAEAVELTGLPRRMSEDDDKADGEPFAKLQALEGAIRKRVADVGKGERQPTSQCQEASSSQRRTQSIMCARRSARPGCTSVICGTTRQRVGRDSGKMSRAPRSTRGSARGQGVGTTT